MWYGESHGSGPGLSARGHGEGRRGKAEDASCYIGSVDYYFWSIWNINFNDIRSSVV